MNIEQILEQNPIKKIYIGLKDYISDIPFNIYAKLYTPKDEDRKDKQSSTYTL